MLASLPPWEGEDRGCCTEYRCVFWLFWADAGRREATGTGITVLYFCPRQTTGNPWGLRFPLASNGNGYIYHLETQRRTQHRHFPRVLGKSGVKCRKDGAAVKAGTKPLEAGWLKTEQSNTSGYFWTRWPALLGSVLGCTVLGGNSAPQPKPKRKTRQALDSHCHTAAGCARATAPDPSSACALSTRSWGTPRVSYHKPQVRF